MKKVITSLFILGTIIAISNCVQNNNVVESHKYQNTESYKEGISLLGASCMSCHAPKDVSTPKIGPNLIAIKAAYLEEGLDETQFVTKMTAFLSAPNTEESIMPKAIEDYGLMPNLGLSKSQYEAVAKYLFSAEIEKPNWYEEEYQKEKARLDNTSEEGSPGYLKKAMTIALSTKAVLGKNLLTAIKTKGTPKALEFCTERAIPITDSLALELNAKIKRVSDKNRNSENSANERELEYIDQAKRDIIEHGKASPKLLELDGQMIAYYPIMTNNMCLQCHGNYETDINEQTISVIKKKYPDDKAIGYSSNELRGIWVIEMDK